MSDAIPFVYKQGKEMADGTWRVTLEIEPGDDAKLAKDTFQAGASQMGAMVRITPEAAQKAAQDDTIRKYGDSARELFRLGFFQVPEVLAAIGSDDDFIKWVEEQPSAFSRNFNEYLEDGSGRCIAHHVRQVSMGAGTGIKPTFATIPVTHQEHSDIHNGLAHPIEEQLKKLKQYQDGWAKMLLSLTFVVSSLSEVEPKEILSWAEANGVEQYLPREYREC